MTPSLKKLRLLLFRRGMSRGRINRITWELEQHLEEVREELADKGMGPKEALEAAQERIGLPETLADEILKRFAHRTLGGRHPVLFTLWMPVLLLAGCVLLEILLVESLGPLLKTFQLCAGLADFPQVKSFLEGVFQVSQYTVTGVAAWILIRTARKNGLELKWVLAATMVLALIGYLLFPVLKIFPPAGVGKIVSGSLALGLGVSFSQWPSADHFARFLLPLLLMGAAYAENIRNGYLKGGWKNES